MSVARGFPNGGKLYSNIVKPIEIDLAFTVTPTNGLGITSLKSNGYVRNVFMHTSTTPASNDGYTNPNPAVGFALIQLKQNFNKYLGNIYSVISPTTGSAISISGSSVLTAGNAYVITSVGAVPAPKFTIATVADVSGSLANKYMTITDQAGNNYVLYNVVSGVGSAPSLTGALANYVAVSVSFASGATAATVAAALQTSVNALNSSSSFTTSLSSSTLTVTGANSNTGLQFPMNPSAGNTGFTVGSPTYTALAADWQSVGLPAGLVPAINQSFIATATGGALGSGQVKAIGSSGIGSMEVVGDPTQSIDNTNIASYGGAWVLVQFLSPTSSSVTTAIPAAPAAGSTVNMSLLFDGSSVTVDGL